MKTFTNLSKLANRLFESTTFRNLCIRILTLFLFAFLLAFFVRKHGPKLVPNIRMANVGTVYPGQLAKYCFKLRNAGDRTLIITDVQTSCSCTVASSKSAIIKPGQTFALDVSMHTNETPGDQGAAVMLFTNQPNARNEQLFIRCFVDPVISVSPPVLDFGSVPAEANAEPMKLEVKPLFGRPLTGFSLVPADSKIKVKIDSLSSNSATAEVALSPGMAVGEIDSVLKLTANNLQLSIPILGRIVGSGHSDPRTVFWGKVSRASEYTQLMHLYGLTDSDLLIKVVPEQAAGLFKFKWLSPGNLKVTLEKNAPPGLMKADITFIHDQRTVLQVPMYGIIE